METLQEEIEVEGLKEDANPKNVDMSDEQIKSQINTAIKDEKLRVKATQSMAQARKNLGLIALEEPRFKPTNMLEELIHTMRWNPEALFECTVYRLLEFESVLCAHILWVKARENKWNC